MPEPVERSGRARQLMAPPPPWRELDPGIRDAVHRLWRAGLRPTGSCEGGRGHPSGHGYVTLEANVLTLDEVAKTALVVLMAAGYAGFSVKRVTQHQRDARPTRSYVAVEFWGPFESMPRG